jgi:RNA polymerase sigma-70 factor (ECF subfamily)
MSGTPDPSDEDLVRRVREGDESAARSLFDRHAAALRAQVRRKLPDELRAKVGESDVVQEAYLAAFLRMTRFEDRGDGSFARWLRGILEHKVLDEVRRHGDAQKRAARRETRIRTQDERPGLSARQRTPSAELAAAEDAAAFREQVARLPEDYRAVLRLVHDEGLTLADAGARMGRSPDAARMLYGRAVAKLTKELGRGPGGPR